MTEIERSIGSDLTKRLGPPNERCLVCRSGYPNLTLINRLLLNGAPAGEVYEIIANMPPGAFPKNRVPSVVSIRNHSKNHLPVYDAVYLRTLEKRAAEAGKDIDSAVESILTTQGMIDVIAQRGFKDIVDGKNSPTVKETIEAIKLTAQFDKDATETFDAVAAMAEVQRIMVAVYKVVPKEYHAAIVAELNSTEDVIIVDEDEDIDWGDGE